MNPAIPVRLGRELVKGLKACLRENETASEFIRNCVWQGVQKRRDEPAWLHVKRGRPRKNKALLLQKNV